MKTYDSANTNHKGCLDLKVKYNGNKKNEDILPIHVDLTILFCASYVLSSNQNIRLNTFVNLDTTKISNNPCLLLQFFQIIINKMQKQLL